MAVYKIVFTSKSEEELIEAAFYYESQQKGLGYRFRDSIFLIINSIENNPFLFQRKYKQYREAPLKEFPFIVIYKIYTNEIIISAIFHTKRKPKNKLKPKL